MLFYTFSDILRIDHLWDFSSLSKLELNNNAIEKIQGLDHLINLTWLSKFVLVDQMMCRHCHLISAQNLLVMMRVISNVSLRSVIQPD